MARYLKELDLGIAVNTSQADVKMMKIKKSFLNLLVKFLPRKIFEMLVWAKIKDPEEVFRDNGFYFKLADTEEELEQSFSILYAEYVKKGFQGESPSKMRVTKYHALPNTVIAVAKYGNEVVGTLTLIPDSGLGLPMDEVWDLANQRKAFRKIAEISSLCVKEGFQKRRGEILFPLFSLLYNLSESYLGIDGWVIATNVKVKEYYQALFGFKPVKNAKQIYPFVRGDIGFGQYIPIGKTHMNRLLKMGFWPINKKIARTINYMGSLVFLKSLGFMLIPSTKKPFQPFLMSPTTLDYFFNKKESVFKGISKEDRLMLKAMYHHQYYGDVISKHPQAELAYGRSQPRYSAFAEAHTKSFTAPFLAPMNETNSFIYDVSDKGAKLYWPDKTVKNGDILRTSLSLSDGSKVSIKAEVRWHNKGYVGVKIIQKSQSWNDWIAEMDSHWQRHIGSNSQAA